MEIGAEGVRLHEIALSPDEVNVFRVRERRRAVGFILICATAPTLYGFMQLVRYMSGGWPPTGVSNQFPLWFGGPFLLVALIGWIVFDYRARSINSCRIRYTMLPKGLMMEVITDRLKDDRKWIIPWWQVGSTIDETNKLEFEPTTPGPHKVPARCFDSLEQRTLFSAVANRG